HPVAGLHLAQMLQGQIVLDAVPDGGLLSGEVIIAVRRRLSFDNPVIRHAPPWRSGAGLSRRDKTTQSLCESPAPSRQTGSRGVSRSDCVFLSRRETPRGRSNDPRCPLPDSIHEL